MLSLLGWWVHSLSPWTSQKDDQGQRQAGKQQHQANGQQGVKQEAGVFQARHREIRNSRRWWSCRTKQKNDADLLSGDSNMSDTNNSNGERQKFQTPAI